MLVSQSLEIYLADDYKIVAKGMSKLLLSLNPTFSITTFENGKHLYSACLMKMPDLIILDMEMPLWNGITTLKNLIDCTLAPIIMLTTNDKKNNIKEAISLGAKGYLHKNCSKTELKKTINAILNS